MKRFFIIILAGIMLSLPATSFADEGMWLVHLIEKGLMDKMKKAGLKLPANVIYDENAVSLSDAVVALDFGCTGSMISRQGLLITNHHCAYGDVHSISTPEHNYLEDGFWAMQMKDEIPIPGKGIYFLRKVLDVSDEVNKMKSDAEKEGKTLGSRKLSSILERKYSEGTGYEASLSGMWRGEKHYLCLYDVYRDVRLVAAPPVSIAAYGGDTDNWEWPQHKGDFAMYRVYAGKDGRPATYSPENIPLVPRQILKISTKGVKKGDFTMILGYPGSTNRYNSSFGVHYIGKVADPITTGIRSDQMTIMDKWMDADPDIRLKYADRYFSLSNMQEYGLGEILTFRRYQVERIRQDEEKELQKWIDSDPSRKKQWGTLLSDMASLYNALEPINKQIITFRETMVRGTQMYYLSIRINNLLRKWEQDSSLILACEDAQFMKETTTIYDGCDLRVEKELFEYSLRVFLQNVEREHWGDGVRTLYDKFGGDIDKLAEYAWDNSFFTDKTRFEAFISTPHDIRDFSSDPIYTIIRSASVSDMNKCKAVIEKRIGKGTTNSLEKQYTNALYRMRKDKGIVQYPDANSTMRITYGTVGPINPSDGIYYSEYSTTQGILDKYNPDDYEFTLKEQSLALLESSDWGRWADPKSGKLQVNFLSNNDITGGNSGSPVMNARGELIGLAFDGNKESLSGDAYFHPDYNKCVSVDIRYVLWILDKYAGMQWILDEIGI